jgi:hypothetical protein
LPCDLTAAQWRLLHGLVRSFFRSLFVNPIEGMSQMYFVAFILAVAAGAFYFAGADGLWADPLCRYGSTFCQHPSWLAVGATLALVWAKVVSV